VVIVPTVTGYTKVELPQKEMLVRVTSVSAFKPNTKPLLNLIHEAPEGMPDEKESREPYARQSGRRGGLGLGGGAGLGLGGGGGLGLGQPPDPSAGEVCQEAKCTSVESHPRTVMSDP
jgi:hypothetical protein